MSFQKFVNDVKVGTLTKKRLEEIWDNYNIKNKSPMIDKLAQWLYNRMETRAKKRGIPLNEVSFIEDEPFKLCQEFIYKNVRSKIPETIPQLEDTIFSPYGTKENLSTGILFKEVPWNNGKKWVASGVKKGPKTYPLAIKQINICISNGWYFETDIPDIVSPFRYIPKDNIPDPSKPETNQSNNGGEIVIGK